jgi:hypothetical protein
LKVIGSLSHTRSPHAVYGDALLLIEKLGLFEIFSAKLKPGKRYDEISLGYSPSVSFLHGEDG